MPNSKISTYRSQIYSQGFRPNCKISTCGSNQNFIPNSIQVLTDLLNASVSIPDSPKPEKQLKIYYLNNNIIEIKRSKTMKNNLSDKFSDFSPIANTYPSGKITDNSQKAFISLNKPLDQ